MKRWFEKMNWKFRHWMIGRYGMDELSRTLMVTGLVFIFGSWIPAVRFLYIPAWICIVYAYFRCFSKKIGKRSLERDKYMKFHNKVTGKINIYKRMWRERKTHRYFKCPNCKTMVRVPKGKGKIVITCTRCHHEIVKRT